MIFDTINLGPEKNGIYTLHRPKFNGLGNKLYENFVRDANITKKLSQLADDIDNLNNALDGKADHLFPSSKNNASFRVSETVVSITQTLFSNQGLSLSDSSLVQVTA